VPVTEHTEPVEESDRRLLREVAGGDKVALRRLYDRLAGRVLSVGLRMLGDHSEAEDLVQEVFIEVWRRAPQYDPPRGTVSAWVTAMSRSRALDRLRAGSRRATKIQAVKAEPSLADFGVQSPEAATVWQERQREVQAALAALPGEQRSSIELAYFEGLSCGEIAERTGQPLGTIKSRLRLALGKLGALLVRGAA